MAVALSAALPAIKVAEKIGADVGDLYQQSLDLVTEFHNSPQHEDERRWEMRVVVISTDHLRPATCNTFLANLAGDDNDVIELLDGYIVRAGDHIDDIPENYPEELQEALVWGINRGYTHVRFDSDGDVVTGLTDFDW